MFGFIRNWFKMAEENAKLHGQFEVCKLVVQDQKAKIDELEDYVRTLQNWVATSLGMPPMGAPVGWAPDPKPTIDEDTMNNLNLRNARRASNWQAIANDMEKRAGI